MFVSYKWLRELTGTTLSPEEIRERLTNVGLAIDAVEARDADFLLDVEVPSNAGVWYTCSYDWTPPEASVGCDGLNAYDETKWKTPKDAQDCCYTFGPIVEKNEHCNAFVYYYPKADDITCF